MGEFDKKREVLVKLLEHEGRILSNEVSDAFLHVPRELFVTEQQKPYAYADTPLSIGHSQTISAPHMVAIMVEALDICKGQKILEIGSGSGYHAAIVSYLVGDTGHVYSVERISSLATFAEENLKKANISNVTVVCSDGSLGLEQYAPYDRIYVTCAAPLIPQPLIDQVKVGGYVLVPVGDRLCILQRIKKLEQGEIESESLGGCAFVPLIGKYGF